MCVQSPVATDGNDNSDESAPENIGSGLEDRCSVVNPVIYIYIYVEVGGANCFTCAGFLLRHVEN